ncbi:MAG: universal stress protein, partial [Ktedonobacteraceae bacterium]|nr:universal stress protein [Ktedonobacteraceae bacterium]
ATVDEIVKTAREMHVNLIVVGSHGDSFLQRLRRFFIGSISHSILHSAPCPVMIVVPPQPPHTTNLVAWYEEAIKDYLNEHTHALSIFTPQQAAQLFAPPNKKKPGRKENAAAALALEHLANQGVLCRHKVQGELRYVND